MKTAILALLVSVALSAAQGTKTFTGIMSDDMCARGDHSQMRMGSTDAECTTACVSAHGAAYVLYDGKNVYKLSGHRMLEQFAGRRVRVIGALDAKTQTIRVDSITSQDKPPSAAAIDDDASSAANLETFMVSAAATYLSDARAGRKHSITSWSPHSHPSGKQY
jgi:hypothetical protein